MAHLIPERSASGTNWGAQFQPFPRQTQAGAWGTEKSETKNTENEIKGRLWNQAQIHGLTIHANLKPHFSLLSQAASQHPLKHSQRYDSVSYWPATAYISLTLSLLGPTSLLWSNTKTDIWHKLWSQYLARAGPALPRAGKESIPSSSPAGCSKPMAKLS